MEVVTILREILDNEEVFTSFAKHAFEKTDTDGSGSIDQTELAEAMRSMAEEIKVPAPSEERMQKNFLVSDKDNSGTIDYNEYLVCARRICEQFLADLQAQA